MLKDYCIGDSVQYISVQYARSGRSACKTCKEKIGQDQLRIGILVDDDHFSTGQGTQWFHQACFHFKPRHKVLDVTELDKKIHNLQALKKKDQKDIIAYLKNQLNTIKQGKSRKKPAQKSKSKPKAQQKVSKSKSKPKKQQKIQKIKSKPTKGQKKVQAPKQQNQEVNKRTTRSRSQPGKKVEQQPEVKPKKERKEPLKAKKVAPKKFVSQAQIKEYKQLIDEYNNKSVNELKQILQKNGQSKTCAKGELVAKCADGKQFGRIPMCSSCGGGKLRFNRNEGTYTCPGYMQDTDFINCGVKLSFDQVTRLKWQQ